MRLLLQIGLVAFGSACGGLLRWGVGTGTARLLGTALPYGTFIINVSGSLFLGWFLTLLADRMVLSEHPWLRPDDLRLMIAVGFTGAYTTFSTFEWEAHGLLRDGETWAGTLYILLSVVVGLVAVRWGVSLARS
ncbi:MAG TPA: fluoride efflux transporter CrcB [Pirellulales bacterium]|nr:fluoride efflux transporter CrcB [Pirellulales bacterium]